MNPRVEFDLKKISSNISRLKTETKNIDFLFPVKCCTNNSILELVYQSNFGFDISNKNEIDKIKAYLDGRFISVSGPLSYELDDYNYNNLHIVSNNLNTWNTNKGLRVNFNSNQNFDKSRFGYDYKLLDSNISDNVKYIHFHNSDHKNVEKCENIYKEIINIVSKFKNLQYINIGGHLEDLEFEEGIEYLNNIRKIIPENINVYVELGDFLFKEAGKLFCKVVDVRNDNNLQHVTLNFSKMANQRWVYAKFDSNNKKTEQIKTIFYGCSCCETDLYLETNAQKLNVGDELEFSNISPYSYEWDTSFNGVEKLNFKFINN